MEFSAELLKLVNILNDHFEKPQNAAGKIVFTIGELHGEILSIYPGAEYTELDYIQALRYLNFEKINTTSKQSRWMIRRTT